jgi:hypothetical protein
MAVVSPTQRPTYGCNVKDAYDSVECWLTVGVELPCSSDNTQFLGEVHLGDCGISQSE